MGAAYEYEGVSSACSWERPRTQLAYLLAGEKAWGLVLYRTPQSFERLPAIIAVAAVARYHSTMSSQSHSS